MGQESYENGKSGLLHVDRLIEEVKQNTISEEMQAALYSNLRNRFIKQLRGFTYPSTFTQEDILQELFLRTIRWLGNYEPQRALHGSVSAFNKVTTLMVKQVYTDLLRKDSKQAGLSSKNVSSQYPTNVSLNFLSEDQLPLQE